MRERVRRQYAACPFSYVRRAQVPVWREVLGHVAGVAIRDDGHQALAARADVWVGAHNRGVPLCHEKGISFMRTVTERKRKRFTPPVPKKKFRPRLPRDPSERRALTQMGVPACNAIGPLGFGCTLEQRHPEKVHIAGGVDTILEVWPAKVGS